MSERILAVLNGAAIFPALVGLVLLALYLARESRRRGLRSMDWLKLPPSMNLVLAMFIFDVGVCLRMVATWIWYASGEQLAAIENLLGLTYLVMTIGQLCKIRALTQPDYGTVPWLVVSVLTVTTASLLFLL